jgi:hypothetical protein
VRYLLALLFRSSLSAVGIALDLMCLLEVRRADPRWLVCRHHQDPPPDGALVIGGDVDLDLLELTNDLRCGSSRASGSNTLPVDLLPQSATAEGVSRALVIDARYVKRIAEDAELGLEVVR